MMKKFIWTNIPVVLILGFILAILDYDNLNTWGYVLIVFSIISFILMIVNIITLYIYKGEEKCITLKQRKN